MPQVNDSINVTPSGSTAVATHLINSKEHQAVVICDAMGYLIDDPNGIYIASTMAMAKSASKNYLSLHNGDGTLIVDVLGLWIAQELTAAVTGLVRGYRLNRTNGTAHSGGTANAPVKLDTASGALDADITVRSNGQTVTASGEALNGAGVAEEETGAAGSIGRIWMWNRNELGLVLPVRPGEGVMVSQDATAGTGFLSAGIIFRVR